MRNVHIAGPVPALAHPDVQAAVAEMLTDECLFAELVRRDLLREEWFVVLHSHAGTVLGRWLMPDVEKATDTAQAWHEDSGANYTVEHHLAAV